MKKILLILILLIASLGYSQVQKIGTTTINRGAKGDDGVGVVSTSVRVVTTEAQLSTALTGDEKILSIQADITLTGDVTIAANAIIQDGGGTITVGNNTVKFQNNSFDFPYNRVVFDFSSFTVSTATLTATGGETTWNYANDIALFPLEDSFYSAKFPTELRVDGVEQGYGTLVDSGVDADGYPFNFEQTFTLNNEQTTLTFRNSLTPLTTGQVLEFDYVAEGDYAKIDDTSTFSDGSINLVNFGLVGDGSGASFGGSGTNTGTDNRNVFLQAQKIYNKNGDAAYIKGKGVYMFEAVRKNNFNGNSPTNLFIEGTASLTLDDNVTIGVLPNNIGNYRTFTLWNSTGYLKGGKIVGDVRHHIFEGEYDEGCHGVTLGGASRNAKVNGTKVSEFSGDCFVPFVAAEIVFSTGGVGDNESIKENAFTSIDGAKGELILDDGTKTSASTSAYVGSNWNYSRFYSLASAKFTTAGLIMIGGNSAFGGNSGLKSNTFYLAYYSDVVDGGTGEYTFIERTELVEQYQLIGLKSEYKYFRIILNTPDVWADLDLNVFAPLIPLNTVIDDVEISYGVRQGISNISPYTKLTNCVFENNGARFTGETGSPSFHIDIEDFYQGLNNIEIANNTFGNAKQGIIILKGTKFCKIHDNIVKYPTDPNYYGRTWSTGNGHETQVYNNTLRAVNASLGRRDNYFNNIVYDSDIAVRLEDETIQNNNFYNSTIKSTQTGIGSSTSLFKNNNWYYDKPLTGSASPMIYLDVDDYIFENELFDFQGVTLGSGEELTNAQNVEYIGNGYINGLEIRGLKSEASNKTDGSFVWNVQNINKLKSSIAVRIQYGQQRDALFSNWEIESWIRLRLLAWAAISSGQNTITIDNLKQNISDATDLDNRYALEVGAKDANILVKNSEINLIFGDNSNANKFLSLSNTGTKVFINTKFYTDHTTPQTRALDSTYEFIDCEFDNITFSGVVLKYTYPSSNAPSYVDNATALAALGEGYYYKNTTSGTFEVTIN